MPLESLEHARKGTQGSNIKMLFKPWGCQNDANVASCGLRFKPFIGMWDSNNLAISLSMSSIKVRSGSGVVACPCHTVINRFQFLCYCWVVGEPQEPPTPSMQLRVSCSQLFWSIVVRCCRASCSMCKQDCKHSEFPGSPTAFLVNASVTAETSANSFLVAKAMQSQRSLITGAARSARCEGVQTFLARIP